ncbi:MAG: dicarboxylate/amino acid:cation symporter [Gammaproteobacteria bacterium]
MRSSYLILIAILLGIMTGYMQMLIPVAEGISKIFIKLLQLLSLPLVFLAILSTLSGIQNLTQAKSMGFRVIKYTTFTTLIAAVIALIFFLVVQPVEVIATGAGLIAPGLPNQTYLDTLFKMIPNNLFGAFAENNVMGIVIIAFMLGFATLSLPNDQQKSFHHLMNTLFQVFLQITKALIFCLPLGVWAFATIFVTEAMVDFAKVEQLSWYLVCILGANLFQMFVVLPLFLTTKGISPWTTFKAVSPALAMAFFSKSSSATLPLAMECNIKRNNVRPQVAKFCLPICSVINMNGCAAFILITVLFVASSTGMTFTPLELVFWVGMATLASIGNASVPMGCYFLASALLMGLKVPLETLMGTILAVYVMIDMVETSLNVWSDCVITKIIDTEVTL